MVARIPTSGTALLTRRPTCQCAAPATTRQSIQLQLQQQQQQPTTLSSRRAFSQTTPRSADIIRRPRRPYQFTQLVQLSDGSTYTMRTCSPLGMYKSTKDTRNHLLWQPSDKSLKSVEVDEAGKLAAFRERFGRSFDLEVEDEADVVEALKDGASAEEVAAAAAAAAKKKAAKKESMGDALGDLIAGYARPEDTPAAPKPRYQAAAGGKKK